MRATVRADWLAASSMALGLLGGAIRAGRPDLVADGREILADLRREEREIYGPSPTGRISVGHPNIQNLVPSTPEGRAIVEAIRSRR